MADVSEKRARTIAVAVDHSEWSEQAFECEYKGLYFSFHAAGVRMKSAANSVQKVYKQTKPFALIGLWTLLLEFLFECLWTKEVKTLVDLTDRRFPAGLTSFVHTFILA